MAEDAPLPNVEQAQGSVEATIVSDAQGGGAESSCNNTTTESSAVTSPRDREKTLEYAEELMERGAKAAKEFDYAEATDCYSRALEIRVAHFGELALECVDAYYKYGCVLLYKAQEEADPLGAVPKKDNESQQVSSYKNGSVKSGINGESSVASVSSNTEQDGSSKPPAVAPADVFCGKDQEENDEESDTEELAEADEDEDEDESDLDLAWKMLDLARAIIEKHSGDKMEKVDILSALAEVSLEREDVETSLSDYLKALAILECLVEPDSRRIAELNFRICLCLEVGSKAEEAIPYCQKAISICKSRIQRLDNELKSSTESTPPAPSELDQTVELSSSGSLSNDVLEKEAEIETLTELSSDLEKKLEDLQQLVSNPTSILSDILGMVSAKARGIEKNAESVVSSSRLGVASSSGDLDSPTVSTAHTNGAAAVTDLGVVGRGVKRVVMGTGATESRPTKKLESGPTIAKDDGKGS